MRAESSPRSHPSPPPAFADLLGDDFLALPVRVRALHTRLGYRQYHGEVEVRRGSGLLSRLCAWATRLPPAGCGPIRVEIEIAAEREHWTRWVDGHAMRSRLWASNGLLCERLGLVSFAFALTVDEGRLLWRVRRVRALGLPLPRRWFAEVVAEESEADGRYHFKVHAGLPGIGLLVHYQGWLEVAIGG